MSWTPEETAAIARDAEFILQGSSSREYLANAVASGLRRIRLLEDRIIALQTKEPDERRSGSSHFGGRARDRNP